MVHYNLPNTNIGPSSHNVGLILCTLYGFHCRFLHRKVRTSIFTKCKIHHWNKCNCSTSLYHPITDCLSRRNSSTPVYPFPCSAMLFSDVLSFFHSGCKSREERPNEGFNALCFWWWICLLPGASGQSTSTVFWWWLFVCFPDWSLPVVAHWGFFWPRISSGDWLCGRKITWICLALLYANTAPQKKVYHAISIQLTREDN